MLTSRTGPSPELTSVWAAPAGTWSAPSKRWAKRPGGVRWRSARAALRPRASAQGRSVLGSSYVGAMACTRRDVLEALDNDACTVSELASQLETSWRAAERTLAGCVGRGWA